MIHDDDRDFGDGYSNDQQRHCAGVRAGIWSDPDPNKCRCHGGGWILSDCDTWEKCPEHFKGQMDPETEMEMDAASEPPTTAAELYGCCNPSGDDLPGAKRAEPPAEGEPYHGVVFHGVVLEPRKETEQELAERLRQWEENKDKDLPF